MRILTGYILAFDNKRVMHGRLAFDPNEQRELELWYVDWDALYSTLRVKTINNNLPQKSTNE